MSGYLKLSEQEKREMRLDGSDRARGEAFQAARDTSQAGNLDAFVDFISDNMSMVETTPTRKITKDHRL